MYINCMYIYTNSILNRKITTNIKKLLKIIYCILNRKIINSIYNQIKIIGLMKYYEYIASMCVHDVQF